MATLDKILAEVRDRLDAKDALREEVLPLARRLIRESATLIKNAHRKEWDEAERRREALMEALHKLRGKLREAPDLWYAGFVQDALKEVAEACLLLAFLRDEPLPTPESLGIDDAPYLNGLLEAMGELRRAALDAIRTDDLRRAEKLLSIMDEVYFQAITFDQADAVNQGARRRTDLLRSLLERTRSDLALAVQYHHLAPFFPKGGKNPLG